MFHVGRKKQASKKPKTHKTKGKIKTKLSYPMAVAGPLGKDFSDVKVYVQGAEGTRQPLMSLSPRV